MKKLLLFIVCMLNAMLVSTREYQHSFGVVVGSYNGLSYKGYVRSSEHFMVQMDLAVQVGITPDGTFISHTPNSTTNTTLYATTYYSFVASPNLMYQGKVAHIGSGTLNWFAGGGIELGILWGGNGIVPVYGDGSKPWGKINEHVIAGMEYRFGGIPLNLGFDFRPGIGEGFYTYNENKAFNTFFFDWGLNLAVRYQFSSHVI